MAPNSPFDELVNRHGTSCLKYDFGLARKGRTDLLPMWVADMDFALPKDILADFHARIDHGIFGYTDPDADYYEALDGWFSRHHGYHIKPEWVTVGCGVVYGLATAIKAFTRPNDAILIQQPVYYPFREVIEDNGRVFVNSQLRNEGGRYTIDFDDVEKKMIAHNVKALLLCSPHNPVGRVWSRKELERLGDLCLTHHVIILCDEIHCDFVYAPHHFTSFLTLDEKYRRNLAVFTSPSKTFNVAGFQPGNIIIPDETLRQAPGQCRVWLQSGQHYGADCRKKLLHQRGRLGKGTCSLHQGQYRLDEGLCQEEPSSSSHDRSRRHLSCMD